jgi:hypothetical protein
MPVGHPLEGWEWKGSRAGVPEDALSAWLARGAQQTKSRKRSIYTRLLAACEKAWAHHASFMLKLGDRTVLDRHTKSWGQLSR